MFTLIVVDDAFEIAGRGVILTPPIRDGLVKKPARVSLRLRLPPDGAVLAASGQIAFQHLRLVGGGSRYQWVLLLDEGTTKPPPGTEVVVEGCDPVDALVGVLGS